MGNQEKIELLRNAREKRIDALQEDIKISSKGDFEYQPYLRSIIKTVKEIYIINAELTKLGLEEEEKKGQEIEKIVSELLNERNYK